MVRLIIINKKLIYWITIVRKDYYLSRVLRKKLKFTTRWGRAAWGHVLSITSLLEYFVLVDTELIHGKMKAYVYMEDQGPKGGRNIYSCVLAYIDLLLGPNPTRSYTGLTP